MPARRNSYGPKAPRTPAQLARAQALTARWLRPPPLARGPDPCTGAKPRRLAKGGGPRQ